MNASAVFSILLSAGIAWLLFKQLAPVKGLRELADRDFREQLQKSSRKLLIDVREPHEFRKGHIAGAVNIPLSGLNSRIGELPKDKELYLYCQSGMRSKRAAGLLLKKGYSQVSHLKGGFSAWSGERTR